jgi:phosphoribosylaminoimidazolecarboxamide formyltransferase / IMP cyclohydrolase
LQPEVASVINRVAKVDDRVRVSRALVSVADKKGLAELVQGLVSINPEITFYSTGGTFAEIERRLGQGSPHLISVSTYTGQPEMQGGLVKTLDFRIYLGLLSESYNDAHRLDLERTSGVRFDLVVSNLYPFERTVAEPQVTAEDARANIDIGGPCMLRAAAKNFLRVAAVCDPSDYPALLRELSKNGGATTLEARFRFAQRAFAHTAAYDAAISSYLATLDPQAVEGVYSLQRNAE